MNTMPKIGVRVRYTSERYPERTCIGTVTKHYPAPTPRHDDQAAIRLDPPLPDWWAYTDGTDSFAPTIAELTPLAE